MRLTPTTLLLISLLLASAALANPLLVGHPAYISYEKLEIKLLDDHAYIDGLFHFDSLIPTDREFTENKVNFGGDVYLDVLLWLPRDPKQADDLTNLLLINFPTTEENHIADHERKIWNDATNLKITIGLRSLEVKSFVIHDPLAMPENSRTPQAWLQQGYYCMQVHVVFPSKWLYGEDVVPNPEVRISYRQSLKNSPEGAEFIYVPTFMNLPDEMNTSDLKQYSMTLHNLSTEVFSLGGAKIRPAASAILPLAHHEAITAIKLPRHEERLPESKE